MGSEIDSVVDGSRTAHRFGEPRKSTPQVLFPGSFNPLHVAHRRMANIAADRLQHAVEFEISVLNVDKAPLSVAEVEHRLKQFHRSESIWLTRAATFLEKARLFPSCTFVVGADTVQRLWDPRYYADAPQLAEVAAELSALQCQFLVFGRTVDGRFLTVDHDKLPPAALDLCECVEASQFRHDISSTEIRRELESGEKRIVDE